MNVLHVIYNFYLKHLNWHNSFPIIDLCVYFTFCLHSLSSLFDVTKQNERCFEDYKALFSQGFSTLKTMKRMDKTGTLKIQRISYFL